MEDVVWPTVDRMVKAGVDRQKAEEAIRGFITFHDDPARFMRDDVIRMAEALDIPLATIHTPADNHNLLVLHETLQASKPETVDKAIAVLNSHIPEFAYSQAYGDPVRLLAGRGEVPLGKIYFSQALGWSPSPTVFEVICRAGIDTCLMTIPSQQNAAVADRYGVNLVHIPHYPVDWIGMNRLYDEVIGDEPIEIIPCSNYKRFKDGRLI